MVESKTQSKEEIKHELLATFKKLLEEKDTFAILEQSTTSDWICRTTTFEGTVLTIASVTAKGLTMEDIAEFNDPAVICINQKLLNDILTPTRLADDEGHIVMYQHIKTPMMVANRCAFLIHYHVEEDGSIIEIQSSKGTEAI